MRTISKVITATATAALAIGGTTAVIASPASAASRNGKCEANEFCLYFNSNQKGSVSDFTGSVADYGAKQPSCFDFKGTGAGKGTCVKNHAASVYNRTGKTVRVYFNSNYRGKYQDFKAGTKGNLNASLKNQNAGHKYLTTTPPPAPGKKKLSYALYMATGGHISCYFDGYKTTKGRHEGIDITRRVGSKVRALVPGKVIYLRPGKLGSKGLSTISIYNASLGKTIIYLHSAPVASLRVGQNIARGQLIATESWHGVKSENGAHTHVEMRNGKKLRAAKSVDDYKLENDNPNPFWRSQGYIVG